MTLSAREFAKLMRDLSNEECTGILSGPNNRRAARVALKNRATIIPYVEGDTDKPVGVEVRDFSTRGIRFLHSDRLPRGSQFVLELPQQAGDPAQILCTVAHCRITPEGPYTVGAEFTCALRRKPKASATRETTKGERERIRQSILR